MADFKVQSGRMRKVIRFMQKVRMPDDMGGGSFRLEQVREDRGYVYPTSSRETFQAQARDARTSHVIELRYFAGLDSNWVIEMDSRHFAILGKQNVDERDRKWILDCEEGVPEGVVL